MKQEKTFEKRKKKQQQQNKKNKTKQNKTKNVLKRMRKTSHLFMASCSSNGFYAPFVSHARTVCISFICSFKNPLARKITLEQ